MKPTLTCTRDSKNVKKPMHLKNGMFLIYAPRRTEISPMQFERNDIEVTVILPEHYPGYFTSKFKLDKIETVTGNQQRIWIGNLNRSLTETTVIQKTDLLYFLCWNKTKRSTSNMRQQQRKTRTRRRYRKKRVQSGGVLNRYDFAYAGRDTVNQLGKVSAGIIKNTSSEINNITQQRINQIISQGSKEIERVLPNILRRAIEEMYQTPFCLLPKFGRQQLQKLKNKNITLDNIYN